MWKHMGWHCRCLAQIHEREKKTTTLECVGFLEEMGPKASFRKQGTVHQTSDK